ncbi:MAG: hypothetical protein ACRDI2_21580 [Chloroflexota bacterium]
MTRGGEVGRRGRPDEQVPDPGAQPVRECAGCGKPLPPRARPKTTLCRVCATKSAHAFLREALDARRQHRHKR